MQEKGPVSSSSNTAGRRRPRKVGNIALGALSFAVVLCCGARLLLDACPAFPVNMGQRLCRLSLCDDRKLTTESYYEQIDGRPEFLNRAIDEFAELLLRDSAAPGRWCDLGAALAQAGKYGEAKYCLGRAVELGPYSPQNLLDAVSFYFEVGESDRALSYGVRILTTVRDYDEALFSEYLRRRLPIAEILRNGMPGNARAGQAFFRFLLKRGDTARLAATWAWLVSRFPLDDQLVKEYVEFLSRNGLAQKASEVSSSTSVRQHSAPTPGLAQFR